MIEYPNFPRKRWPINETKKFMYSDADAAPLIEVTHDSALEQILKEKGFYSVISTTETEFIESSTDYKRRYETHLRNEEYKRKQEDEEKIRQMNLCKQCVFEVRVYG